MSISLSEKSYAVEARYANFYAGGDVAWSSDGKWMYCHNGSEITKVDVNTGLVIRSYGLNVNEDGERKNSAGNAEDEAMDDDDTIYSFDLSSSQEYMVTVHRSSLVRLWHLPTGKVEKLWKSQHKGPVVKVVFSSDAKLVCTSGADSSLRIWDYENSRCLCALKEFTGPSTLLRFHPNSGIPEIYAAGSDNAIYRWNYDTKSLLSKLKGHLSQVTGFDFCDSTTECPSLATVSRDKVLIVWDLKEGKQIKVVPLYEELIGVSYKDPENVVAVAAKGSIKTVNCKTGKISALLESQEEFELKMILKNDNTKQLAVITTDHNILLYDLEPKLKCLKHLIGFNDEILDICFLGESEQFLAVATNSKHIKLYDIENSMNCNIVMGHKDTVMSLSSPGSSDLLLSAGKDFNIILWQLDTKLANLKCLAKSTNSHTSTIGSISFAYHSSAAFASVCQSGSLKVWSLSKKKTQKDDYEFSVKYAAVAHDKEINCVTFSPNNKLIGTASQDKTAKLWSADSHSIIGTLRGHTRGVWCVRFSPTDQIVMTTSSDCTLRLWSLSNLSCLKRLEQTSTVLRAEFIDHGKYIVSSGSDGLIKLWNIKTNACVQTLDEHEDRAWSLAVSSKTHKYFFSAAADSKLIKWKDITEESKNSEIDKRQEELLQEQNLQNLLYQNKNVKKAFALALRLSKPRVTYKILNQCIRERDHKTIKHMIEQLNTDQKLTLMDHVKVWSCNARYSQVSNVVLQQLLSEMMVESSLQRTLNARNVVEVVTPYVQRHFKRVTELGKELHFLDFIVQNI